MMFVRMSSWLLCLSAIFVSVDGKCAYLPSFQVPNGDTELIIYGFSLDNTESGDATLTGPFKATVGGVLCAQTDKDIDANSKIQEFSCPKPLNGNSVDIVAKSGKIYICKLIVSGHPKCNDFEKYDFEAGNCVCSYGVENGKCRPYAPCGENSQRVGTVCQCNKGYSLHGDQCKKQGFSKQFSPLTGICNNYEKYDYCKTSGDCSTVGSFHVIRHVGGSPGVEKCKASCNEECACNAFRILNDRDCWLTSAACSVMDNPDPAWTFYTKRALGQSCDDAQFDCRKADVGYCKRAGDCYNFNIRNIGVTRDECETRCTQECACKAFFHDGGRGCWLKGIACTTRTHQNTAYQYYVKTAKGEDCDYAIAGRCRDAKFKYCRRSGDCWGHNIRNIAAGLEDCKRECDKECSCRAFWKDRGLGCYIKSIACNVLSHTNSDQDYYVKIAADEPCPREFGMEEPGVQDK